MKNIKKYKKKLSGTKKNILSEKYKKTLEAKNEKQKALEKPLKSNN